MAVLDRNFGSFGTASGITITRSTGVFGTGTVLVVALFTNTTWATPAGWEKRTESVANMGLYSFDRPTAGETSFALAPNVAGTGFWFAWELSAGSSYINSTAAEVGAVSSVTPPAITPSAGNRHLLAVAGGVSSQARSVTGFNNSFINMAGGQVLQQDQPFAARADRDVAADGSTAFSTTATFNLAASISGSMLLAYANAASGPDIAPPSAPTGLVASNVTGVSANLAWSPSSDDVAVTGYEIQIVGP